MAFSSIAWFRLPKKTIVLLTAIFLGLSLWGCNVNQRQDAIQPDTDADPQLEAQVLEIIRQHPEVVIESVQKYQQEQQQQQREQQEQAVNLFRQQVLNEPKSAIGNAPVMGSEDYQIILIEFSDFECPFCSRAYSTIKTFMSRHGDSVTLAYKHLPLEAIHPQATPAAEAAWAAQQQDKFWDYHDRLFENQDRLGDELYQEIARDLGLDMEKFAADRKAAAPAVQRDLQLAQRLGLNGTPFFVFASIETGKVELFSGALTLEQFEEKLTALTTP